MVAAPDGQPLARGPRARPVANRGGWPSLLRRKRDGALPAARFAGLVGAADHPQVIAGPVAALALPSPIRWPPRLTPVPTPLPHGGDAPRFAPGGAPREVAASQPPKRPNRFTSGEDGGHAPEERTDRRGGTDRRFDRQPAPADGVARRIVGAAS